MPPIDAALAAIRQTNGSAVAAFLLALIAAILGWRARSDRATTGLLALSGLLVAAGIGLHFRTPLLVALVSPLTTLAPGSIQDRPTLYAIKAVVALVACALSIYEGDRRLRRQPTRRALTRGVALALALVAVGGYYRFGDTGYSRFYHRWEFFHYYLGSKYFHELEYTRLYKCTAIAQADLGMANEVRARKLRDLVDDVIVPAGPVIDDPAQCRDRFTPERWSSFKADVKWFRGSSNLQYWNDMQKDHGYNPPPVWSLEGHLLASLHPADDGYFKLLAAIDPLLFAGTFAAIGWAFGLRVMCAGLVFWGCQLPAEYFWTGGAFLRQDWLFFLVLSACLAKKRKWALAGGAMAWSTLLRAFPGGFLLGWLVVAASHFARTRRIAKSHLRVAMGGIVASVILVSASVAVCGVDSYKGFLEHIETHTSTPLTNNMGLKTLVAHGPSGRMKFVRDEKLLDPFEVWKKMRIERADHQLRPLYRGVQLLVLAAFVYVVWRVRRLWVAQALALAVVISLLEMTCYYYSFFLLAVLLSRIRRGFEQAALFVAGFSQLLVLNNFVSYYYDDRYTAQSALFFLYSLGLLCAFWPRRSARGPSPTAAAAAPGSPSPPLASPPGALP